MKRKLINTITIEKSNLEYIADTGKINGTLLKEIERIMDEYKALNIHNVISCLGVRYNFKKGTEHCPNKNECKLYNPDDYENAIDFKTIKDFRNCDKYK